MTRKPTRRIEFTVPDLEPRAGQVWQRWDESTEYRLERVTACFALLTKLPDGKPGGFGRVRLANLTGSARRVR